MHPENLEVRKLFGMSHEFKVCTGTRYIGGYIRYDKYKRDCLKKYMETWERKICMISETAGNHPQGSYAAVVQAIQ